MEKPKSVTGVDFEWKENVKIRNEKSSGVQEQELGDGRKRFDLPKTVPFFDTVDHPESIYSYEYLY